MNTNMQIPNQGKFEETKLVIVTRNDISDGYKIAQSCHSIADFAAEHPQQFKDWKQTSNSIICLSVKDEAALLKLHTKYKDRTQVSLFYEPDVDQYTSMCFYGTPAIRKKLAYLPLIMKSKTDDSSVSTTPEHPIINPEPEPEPVVQQSTSLSFRDVISAMKNTEQTKGQSVLEHGLSVKNYLFDLLDHLRLGTTLKYEWNIPAWVYDNREYILSQLPDDKTLRLYTILHDIGKPHTRIVDTEGKVHFPNHSNVSYETFKRYFDNDIAAELIKHDMDIHTLKADGVDDFCKNPYHITSLFVGLCELHSNASMFGGLLSQGFRIKHKSITQRGKAILSKIKSDKNVNV